MASENTERTIVSMVSSPSGISSSGNASSSKKSFKNLRKNLFPPETKVSKEALKYYRRKKQQLEVDILQLKQKWKLLRKKRKNVNENKLSQSALTFEREQVKNRISAEQTGKISRLILDYAYEKQNSNQLKNQIDLINFQIEAEREKREHIADMQKISNANLNFDFGLSQNDSSSSEETKKDLFQNHNIFATKSEQQRNYLDVRDMLAEIDRFYSELIVTTRNDFASSSYQNAAKEIEKSTFAEVRLMQVTNNSLNKEIKTLRERVDNSDKTIQQLEKEIKEKRKQMIGKNEEMRQEIADSSSKNDEISSTWSGELAALDQQQLQLLKSIDSSSRVFDQTVYEIKEITQQFNTYELEMISEDASYISTNSMRSNFLYDGIDNEDDNDYSDSDEEENNATLNYLILKRNQTAEELDRMKREIKELRSSYLKREAYLKDEIRKKIAKLKEVKTALLGGIQFDVLTTTSTESSGLLSLDGFSFTK